MLKKAMTGEEIARLLIWLIFLAIAGIAIGYLVFT